MLILNFAHPLTEEHLAVIEGLAQQPVGRVVECPAQFDPQLPFAPQVEALLEEVGLSPREWQTLPLLVNLPALNYIAGIVVAMIHGRAGYFPTMLRLRPVANTMPLRFEVAELVDLQGLRDREREKR